MPHERELSMLTPGEAGYSSVWLGVAEPGVGHARRDASEIQLLEQSMVPRAHQASGAGSSVHLHHHLSITCPAEQVTRLSAIAGIRQ